ncbi:hypothetical protein ALC60_10231 [Trachymyrmex zeteki]|uniref:Uncharacterized protein n=1 Tax=Mycetomoellerius zeteki TaxID=64791 RepID=A0A151WS85_9HYME|nr:hypothetical protein ALC60_10231 [Trachymyrmex zeteki]
MDRESCGIGYDCGSASTNLTTLSLVNIEECDIPLQNVNSTKVYVQLLQVNDFKSVRVIQCKIEIDRLVRKCGMFSHTMDVYNGKHSYIIEVSREACQRTYGSFELSGTYITGLKSNQTATRPVFLADHVNVDGTLLQQCDLESRMLQNALAIAARSSDVFAYHFMKGSGYMALLAREVIYIVKYVPIEVKLAQKAECYEQLPVLRGNHTYFLTPQTHVLLRQGTQITCNSFAPTMYLLGDSWYKFMPKPVETLPPTIMKPSTKPSWRYIITFSLGSGIYSQNDLDELNDHIMFPAERPAVLNTVARGIMGHSTILHGGSLANLIDEASIEKIAIFIWQKFWSKFILEDRFREMKWQGILCGLAYTGPFSGSSWSKKARDLTKFLINQQEGAISILGTIRDEAAFVKLKVRSGGDARHYHEINLKETLISLGYAERADKLRTRTYPCQRTITFPGLPGPRTLVNTQDQISRIRYLMELRCVTILEEAAKKRIEDHIGGPRPPRGGVAHSRTPYRQLPRERLRRREGTATFCHRTSEGPRCRCIKEASAERRTSDPEDESVCTGAHRFLTTRRHE